MRSMFQRYKTKQLSATSLATVVNEQETSTYMHTTADLLDGWAARLAGVWPPGAGRGGLVPHLGAAEADAARPAAAKLVAGDLHPSRL